MDIKTKSSDSSKDRGFKAFFWFLFHQGRRNPLLVLGVGGIVLGIVFTLTLGNPSPPPSNQLTLPPSSPFEKNVSGLGIVEANTRNINIGSHLAGIITSMHVKEGDKVKKDAPLFTLDARTAEADVLLKERQIAVSEANVASIRALYNQAEDQVLRSNKLQAGLAMSDEERKRRQFVFEKAKADLLQAHAQAEQAKAELHLSRVNLEKLTVRAPIEGDILKVRMRVGEFISTTGANTVSPLLMGSIQPLHLRVQIDENDVWRYEKGLKAVAFLTSNKDIHFPLTFVRVEPYAQPKQQLSGDSSEKVDTRVLEAVYRIEGNTENLYVGQQLDVFLETNKGA